jgi:hypothetical protein
MDLMVRCLLGLVLLRYARQEASMRRLIDCAALCVAAIVLALALTVFIGYAGAYEGDVGHVRLTTSLGGSHEAL